ncbi:hypothetical protein KAJ89_05970 [Candidatus Parcubacteria bacterium]|nr:hypothetical protein [Candidatus Parcubacteria bacterium]
MKKNLEQRICLSLTGIEDKDWQSKLNEINNLGLDTIALILENFSRKQRQLIYEALEDSSVKNVPLIHLKNDMSREELEFLRDRYKSQYLTIHEDSFGILEKWHGHYQNLFLEFNFDDYVPQNVKVEKIGGFCVDLAHFKVAQEKWTKEFEYVIQRRNNKDIFACNHLSGYSKSKNRDLHDPKSIKDFEYLKTLPDFVFGKVIALEVYNSIKEQLEFKKQIIKLLNSD